MLPKEEQPYQPDKWLKKTDEKNRDYWINSVTSEIRWDPPSFDDDSMSGSRNGSFTISPGDGSMNVTARHSGSRGNHQDIAAAAIAKKVYNLIKKGESIGQDEVAIRTFLTNKGIEESVINAAFEQYKRSEI